ncbi:MAG: class I SAM-dependent methyltransferase [Nanoarchaeota archaeon]
MRKLSPETWDSQYQRGQWDHLLHEQERNKVLGELGRKYHPHPVILDVGCGFGNLLPHLTFQRYMGIDLSAIALKQAPRGAKVQFLCVEAEQFQTADKFDFIIFNEILYYMDAFAVLDKYKAFLTPRGIFLISMWKHPTTVRLWEEIERKYDCIEWREVQDGQNEWKIGVIRIRLSP